MNVKPSVNYQRFPSSYFSGCDMRIYFQDTLIDEVVQMQFVLQEQLMPVFGYNSYTFDETFRGARMIEGSFAINYKDNNYLSSAIAEASNNKEVDSKSVIKGNINVDEFSNRGFSKTFDSNAEKLKEKHWGTEEEQDIDNKDKPFFNNNGFNILISYGSYDIDMYGLEGLHKENESKGTYRILENIQLTGCNQSIDLSGQPILEAYSFIAQDLK